MVTEVTAGLQGVVCHMDNILIWGTTKEQHDARVHAVLQRAEKAGVTLNMAKCEFGKREIVPGLHCLSRWREARSRKKKQSCAGHERASPVQLYDPNIPQKISADASSYGLGAVLLQKDGGVWSPVAYASRSLTDTEQCYAQLEKEALTLTWACEKFSDVILGFHYELGNDHIS